MENRGRKSSKFAAYDQAAVVGPGTWFTYHLKSFNLFTEARVISYLEDIDLLRLKFSCGNCRGHFNEFCEKYPPSEAAERDKADLSRKIRAENLARWTVDAHTAATENKLNWIAKELGTNAYAPDEVKYEDVRDYFDSLGQEPCVKDCHKTGVKVLPELSKTTDKDVLPAALPALAGTAVPVVSIKIRSPTPASYDWKSTPREEGRRPLGGGRAKSPSHGKPRFKFVRPTE
jgi:hypothetical protein